MATKIIYPTWMDSLDGLPRHRAELEYILRLVALHHNSDGSLPKLALAMGLIRTRLHICIHEARIRPEMVDHLLLMGPNAVLVGVTKKKLAEFIG